MFVIENLLLCRGLTKTVNSETNFGILCLNTHTRDLQWTPEDLDLQRKVKKGSRYRGTDGIPADTTTTTTILCFHTGRTNEVQVRKLRK